MNVGAREARVPDGPARRVGPHRPQRSRRRCGRVSGANPPPRLHEVVTKGGRPAALGGARSPTTQLDNQEWSAAVRGPPRRAAGGILLGAPIVGGVSRGVAPWSPRRDRARCGGREGPVPRGARGLRVAGWAIGGLTNKHSYATARRLVARTVTLRNRRGDRATHQACLETLLARQGIKQNFVAISRGAATPTGPCRPPRPCSGPLRAGSTVPPYSLKKRLAGVRASTRHARRPRAWSFSVGCGHPGAAGRCRRRPGPPTSGGRASA